MTRVEIECLDLTYHNEWMDQKDVDNAKSLNVLVSGILVGETDTVVKVSALYSPETERSGYLIIVPKGCIVKRKDYAQA